MFCSKCGGEVPEGVRFCTGCGSEAAPPLPMPPSAPGGTPVPPFTPGPQDPFKRSAASENRRLVLIIIGIVVGIALLVVGLAVALMVVISHEADDKLSPNEIVAKLTYTLPENTSDDDAVIRRDRVSRRTAFATTPGRAPSLQIPPPFGIM